MKVYEFTLSEWSCKEFFAPIRCKNDLIELLMNSLKLMTSGSVPSSQSGRMQLVIAKQSRLYFFSDSKCFSIGFPFTTKRENGNLSFNSPFVSNIDSKTTSDVLAVLRHLKGRNISNIYEFMEPVLELEEVQEGSFWSFFIHLLTYEDGYVRYDVDSENENGDLHPLCHYDIFYASGNTCKIGLRESLSEERMVDFLRIETNCHFIEPQEA